MSSGGKDRNKNNYGDIGKQITASLSEGLKSGDFTSLNRVISDSLDSVLEDIGINPDMVRKTSDYDAVTFDKGSRTRDTQERIAREHEARRQAKQKRERELEEAEKRRRERVEKNNQNRVLSGRYRKVNNALTIPGAFKPVGRTAANIMTTGGAVGMVFFGAGTLIRGISGLLLSGSLLSAAGPAAAAIVSFCVFFAGLHNKGILSRAERYAALCGERMYSSLENLASGMGMKPRKVLRDIKKLLKRGYYPEGYLDEKETTLMLSRSVYEEYRRTEQQRKLLEEEKNIIDMVEGDKELEGSEKTELEAMVNSGISYINRLHALNDEIKGEVISDKLTRLEGILREIFNCVKEHPEQMGRIHKLMDYYLPTMLKLVEAYAEYDRISTPGDEILKAKEEIEATLDKINDAFTQLLNSLFRDSVWDVTSDAKVLETMLKQDGLDKGF